MEASTPIQFDPTVEELNKMVEVTKDITATDLKDKAQLKVVREARIALKNARVTISKKGKEMRDGALAYQRAVIAKENELIGIISPEEERLESIEDEAKAIALREERMAILPERKARLDAIGDGVEVSDEYILDLDEVKFESYATNRQALKNAADQNKIEADRVANELEKQRLENEKNAREREEKARQEERERAEEEAARKEKERIENEALQKAEQERREREEQERLERQEKYRAFRESHGWTADTKADFKEENVGSEVVLWKKLGTFKLK
jgi:hypothetical protein